MQGRGWRELSRAWLLRVSSAAARLFAFGSWRDISREAWKTSNAPPPTARAAMFGQVAARRSLPALRLWWLFRGERKDKKALLQEERLQKQAVRALCELLAGEEPSAQRLNALALLYNNNIRRCIAAFSSQGLASALLALDKQGGDVDTFYRVLAERVAGTKRVRWKGREALIKATLLRAVADTHCQLLGYEAKDAHQRDRARRSASRILVLLPPRVRAELRRTAQNSWAELLGSAVAVSNLSNSEPSLSKALQCLRSWEGEARKAAENHYRPLERTNKEGEGDIEEDENIPALPPKGIKIDSAQKDSDAIFAPQERSVILLANFVTAVSARRHLLFQREGEPYLYYLRTEESDERFVDMPLLSHLRIRVRVREGRSALAKMPSTMSDIYGLWGYVNEVAQLDILEVLTVVAARP